MATYRVTLMSRTGLRYGLLRGASGGSGPLTFGTVINAAGSWTVNPSLALELISGVNRGRLHAWASEVVIERLTGPGYIGPVMAGPVLKPHADLDGESLTVTGTDVWGWLGERLITDPLGYADWDQLKVPADLIKRYTTGLGPAGDIRLGIGAYNPSGVAITQAYAPTDQKTVATAIGDLSSAINGFDFAVLYDKTRTGVTRTWQPYYPQKGRKIPTPLTPGRGGLRGFTIEEATAIATRVTGTGQITYTQQVAAALEDTYGIHTQSFSLVAQNSISLLQRQVQKYLAVRTPPVYIVSFGYQVTERTPYGFHADGDSIHVKAGKGWAEFDGWVRVVGTNVTVDTEGNEQVTCTAYSTGVT